MSVLALSAGDVAYWALAIFLVAIGLGTAYMLFRLGQTFERISSLVRGTERDLLPVIVKTGATVDRVNYQLDKADSVTDSAVSMADSADTAVRAVSTAIAKPVEKVSGLAAGVSHGFSQFRKSRSFGDSAAAAKEAAAPARSRSSRGSPPCGPDADEHAAARPRSRRLQAQPKPDPWQRPEPVAKPDPAPAPQNEPTAA